jgi:hypothetical protein
MSREAWGMQRIVKALELTGTVDEKRQLHLDEPLPGMGPSRVRILILVTEEQEITEDEWLRAAAANAAFDFLQNPAEDMYTLDDGKPFHDEG